MNKQKFWECEAKLSSLLISNVELNEITIIYEKSQVLNIEINEIRVSINSSDILDILRNCLNTKFLERVRSEFLSIPAHLFTPFVQEAAHHVLWFFQRGILTKIFRYLFSIAFYCSCSHTPRVASCHFAVDPLNMSRGYSMTGSAGPADIRQGHSAWAQEGPTTIEPGPWILGVIFWKAINDP